jgi:hypothetical protein
MSSRKRTRSAIPEIESAVDLSLNKSSFKGNGHELSEYEISRINNIQRNENFLASLGLDSVKQSIDYFNPPKRKFVATKGVTRNTSKSPALPARRSARVTADKLKAEVNELSKNGKITESLEKQEQLDEMLTKQREGRYEVPDTMSAANGAYNRELKLGPVSLINDLENKVDDSDKSGMKILKLLQDLSVSAPPPVSIKSKKVDSKHETKDVDLTEYVCRLNSLSLAEADVAKLTPSRVTCVAVHPARDKVVVMAGDKNGYLGIWDLNHVPDADTSSKAGPAATEGVYTYSPHISNISNIHCHPEDSSIIRTVSYDGTIRCLDLSQGSSEPAAFALAFRHPEKDDDIRHFYYTDAAFHSQNKSVCLVSRSDGCVSLIDFRASATEYQNSGAVQEGVKINSLQCHPANEFMVVSAGAARGCIAINDTRMLSGMRGGAKLWKPIKTLHLHSKSINAAYCSPGDGRYLVSVSQDNTVRVVENYLEGGGEQTHPSSSR